MNSNLNRLILLLHIWPVALLAIVFFHFYPNANGEYGMDFELFTPMLADGALWLSKNGLFSIEWFTPAFCGGVPAFSNPQNLFISLPQWLAWLTDPFVGVGLSILIMAILGYVGTFLLARKTLQLDHLPAALIGAVFVLNGFYLHRMIVGHVNMQAVMLAPWLVYCLVPSSTKSEDNTSVGALMWTIPLASIIIAYMIYSGMSVVLLPTLFGVGLTLLLISLIRSEQSGKSLLAFLVSCLGGAVIASPKLVSALTLAENFPRNYSHYLSPEGYLLGVFYILHGLFIGNASPSQAFPQDTHEWEYSLSLLSLVLVVWLITHALKKSKSGKAKTNKANPGWIAFILLAIVPFFIAVHTQMTEAILSGIPVISRESVHARWLLAYHMAIIVLAAYALKHVPKLNENQRLVYAVGSVVLVLSLFFGHRWDAYENNPRSWNPKTFTGDYFKAMDKADSFRIEALHVDQTPDGKLSIPVGRNASFLHGRSYIACYEPLFGYMLESLNFGTMQLGPVDKVSDDAFNVKNPACYVYPSENNCRPGDNFTSQQKEAMEKFVSYKPFSFQQPWQQSVANWMGILSFLVAGLMIAYSIFRKQS